MSRYDQLCAAHEWRVPERYNIAADVCDKHPRDKLAMIWERFDGAAAEVTWGELQDLANQAAHLLRRPRRRAAATASRSCCRRRRRRRRSFFGTWKLGAHPAVDVGALRRRGRSRTA